MLKVINQRAEYMENPIGIETKNPRLSWQIESDKKNVLQTEYQIKVEAPSGTVWDSGRVQSSDCTAVEYGGLELTPCTQYSWSVTVWDNKGESAKAGASFETGFMDESCAPWENAVWIGAHKPTLYADTKGVFAVETKIKIESGKAGLIFGAMDKRLLDKNKNIMGVEGKSKISYEIDISGEKPMLLIRREGYCKQDKGLLWQGEIRDVNDPKNTPITAKNKNDYHVLRVEVYGNTAKAFIDGVCVDGVFKKLPFLQNKEIFVGRQLNPLSDNDTITFPRLNKIGFTAAAATARYIKVMDIQNPCAELFCAENPVIKNDEDVLFDPSQGAVPMLRRDFTVEKPLEKARLYVTCRGVYDGIINGKPVGEALGEEFPTDRSKAFLQPGASQFDKHLFYNVYDIGEKIIRGDNALTILMSSGWWSDSQTFSLPNHNYFGDRPSVMAKLKLYYKDGTQEVIVTDTENWKLYDDGPLRFSGFFAGERYMAEKEFSGCYLPGFDVGSRKTPCEIEVPKRQAPTGAFHMWPVPNQTEPKIICHVGTPVKHIKTLTAQSVKQVKPGVFVYDMGQNLVGVPHIRVKEQRGKEICLRYGETCYPYLELYGELGGMILTENLRDAESTDIYVCKGDEKGEEILPRFTFHGYRFVEISGAENPPDIKDVRALVISSFLKDKSEFTCGNKDINRLYQNILWSQRANFISIPTDCPQRNERMGWMGDAQVFAPTAVYNDDVRLFFERYLLSVRDLQSENGQFPCIAPVGGGFGGTAWESAGVIIPWVLYTQYGDKRVLRDNLKSMTAYGEYLAKKLKGNILDFGGGQGGLGDWLGVDLSTDTALIWNAISAYDMRIIRDSAKILGEKETQERFSQLYDILKAGFNESFFKNGRAVTDTQCSYALPLYYKLYNDDNRQAAAKRLAELTAELNYTLTTGFIGTPCIAPALWENGYGDVAYKLLCQNQYPSWLYPITQGATTIWERWNSYTVENGFGGNNAMNSFNHYSLGAVGYFMMSGILGIKPADVGFKNIEISPAYNKEFGGASGSYESPMGKISVSWVFKGDELFVTAEIPPNTTAQLKLPRETKQLGSGAWSFTSKEWGGNTI